MNLDTRLTKNVYRTVLIGPVVTEVKQSTALKVLIVEDSDTDLALLVRALRNGGFDINFRRVQSVLEIKHALETEPWQIVISDFNLPGFDAKEALKQVIPYHIPFFVVSGTISEDIAAELMKAGAQDYVMKANLSRLIPAIYRELEEAHRRAKVQEVLQQKEELLRHAQKMEAIGRLAGGIAHDFNNFLGVIQILTEQLGKKVSADNSAVSDVRQILDTVERAASLTRQLLMFSRKQTVDPVTLNVNARIKDLYPMFSGILGENIDFQLDLSEDLHGVEIDPSQFEQTLLNLIVNAADAMPEKGSLQITTSNHFLEQAKQTLHDSISPGPYVKVSVKDSGCGMDEETLKLIFEPFFTTKGNEGTGIGLPTVFGIVKNIKGYVSVESQPGMGSQFTIYFPSSGPLSKVEMVQRAILKDTKKRETLLLVDDQNQMREIVAVSLRDKGFTVFEADCPNKAISLYQQHTDKIQMLITDLNLPEMSGIQLVKSLGQISPNLKFIVISGFMDDKLLNEEGQICDESSLHLLTKPFSTKTLIDKIENAFKF